MAAESSSTTIPTPQTPGRPTVRRVLCATARHYGVTVPELLTRSRKTGAVRRRQMAAYIARKTTSKSLKLIANRLGGFDHTTIHWSVRATQARLDAGDATTAAAVDAIVLDIEGGAQ